MSKQLEVINEENNHDISDQVSQKSPIKKTKDKKSCLNSSEKRGKKKIKRGPKPKIPHKKIKSEEKRDCKEETEVMQKENNNLNQGKYLYMVSM